ncbi:MAG TPA: iron ABC transporter permease [Bryobacteraceae bacterium]|nr:iron ABC transporter permease [Bryobacteraceae bacterium]
MGKRRVNLAMFYAALFPILVVSVLVGIGIGSTNIDWRTILHVAGLKLLPAGWVHSAGVTKADTVIVWLIRVPRVVVAAFVGMGLAAAGAIMQGLFRNPLAEPGTVGTGSGAILGAVIAFAAGWSTRSVISLPLMAMIGAFAALVIVYAMATRGGVTPVGTLLLAGIAMMSLLSAISSLLISLSVLNWQIGQEIVFWMMGGLDARSWTHVWLCAPFILLGIAAAMFQTKDLDLIQQGEETAASFGVDVESSKRYLALTAAILTGASVAVAGGVGFVGLVVPHAVRLLVGPSNRALIPASALTGGAFLILCDLLARTIHPPVEIRLGVITALVGGPLFIALLLQRYWEASDR